LGKGKGKKGRKGSILSQASLGKKKKRGGDQIRSACEKIRCKGGKADPKPLQGGGGKKRGLSFFAFA